MDGSDRRFSAFAGWVLAHLIAYAAAAIAIRYLFEHFRIIEIAAIRSAGSLLIAAMLLLRSREANSEPAGIRLADDIKRSLLHLAGSLALIWSIVNLPLVFVATVEFSGPLFAALIGWFVARQFPNKLAGAGLGLIILGCILLFYQQGIATDLRLFIPVLAVMFLTTSNFLLARLAQTRRIASIILVMHAIQFPAYIVMLAVFHPGWLWQILEKGSHWQAGEWGSILISAMILAVAGFVTQAALANASRHGTTLQLCAADILRLPLIAVVGFIVFGEPLALALIVPGLIVVIGSLIASFPNPKSNRGK